MNEELKHTRMAAFAAFGRVKVALQMIVLSDALSGSTVGDIIDKDQVECDLKMLDLDWQDRVKEVSHA